MPEFQKKPRKFFARGMNLNRPIDAIPEDQFAYLLNLRTYKDGELTLRPGLSEVLATSLPVTGVTDYLHTIVSLNDYDPDSTGGACRFLGYNTSLYWGSGLTLSGFTKALLDSGYSGNPLSTVIMAPEGNPVPFLYVGDSAKMRKYSPAYQSAGLPIIYTVGLNRSTVEYAPFPNIVAAGNLTGSYQWRWVLRHKVTGAESSPGPVSFITLFQNQTGQQAQFTSPNSGVSSEYVYDLYRFGGTIQSWRYVASVPNNTSYTDNLADADILAAKELLTDAASLKFQPFVTQALPTTGTATVAAGSTNDGSSLTLTSGVFNVNWINGTTIVVAGVAAHIRRIQSATVIYVEEDLGALGGVDWSVDGALQAGFPLPHLFGPYGAGQGGLFVFGVGDPRSPGSLYWMNGNDPDTTSLANRLEITGPSEPLQNGCIWNSRAFVWSTDRMWEIKPDLITPGQFVAEVVPGGKGLFAPWGLCVGDVPYFISKDGIYKYTGGTCETITDDQLGQFFGHDGQPGESVYLPNPADNFATEIVIGAANPNEVQTWRLCWADGMIYFDYIEFSSGDSATLVYDTHIGKGWFRDIYYQTGTNHTGYVSRYVETGQSTVVGADPVHTTLVGIGSELMWFNGAADAGQAIPFAMMTGADLLGGYRNQKLIGDVVIGAVSNSTTIAAKVLSNTNTASIASANLLVAGGYSQTLLDVDSGDGELTRSVGLWLSGSTTSAFSILDWEPSYIVKPEYTDKRATDWTDDGKPGNKFLTAVVIHANVSVIDSGGDLASGGGLGLVVSSPSHTFSAGEVGSVIQVIGGSGWAQGTYVIQSVNLGQATLDHSPGLSLTAGEWVLSGSRTVELQYDSGSVATTLTLVGAGETEQAYAVNPAVVGKMFRILPTDSSTCQLFSVHYVWSAYPEFIALDEDYDVQKYPAYKYVRGVVLEVDTQGIAARYIPYIDGTAVGTLTLPAINGKQLYTLGFTAPGLANEVKVRFLDSVRKFSIRWIFDEYPDNVNVTSWERGTGEGRARYIRGGIIHLDTFAQNYSIQLQGDGGANIGAAFSFNASGQTGLAFALNPPVKAHLTRWNCALGQWMYFRTVWDEDVYPELIAEWSTISDLGHNGAKFMQGVRITADTNNVAVQFRILYDGGQTALDLPATAFNGKQTIAFSFPTPFIAHDLQIQPLAAARLFPETMQQFVWEPVPELATTWQTQQTNHDIPGYHYMRDGWIAYQSAPGAVVPETLTVTTEYGSIVYSLPVSTSYKRYYQVFTPQKAKWRSYRVDSTLGVRMFVKDTTIRIKGWGASGEWMVVQPFGDLSRAAGARI